MQHIATNTFEDLLEIPMGDHFDATRIECGKVLMQWKNLPTDDDTVVEDTLDSAKCSAVKL